MTWKSPLICCTSHVEKDHNLQSSALSQSKNDHSGTLNINIYIYICKQGKSLWWSSSLGAKTPKRLYSKTACATQNGNHQTSLINKTIYCHIIVNI